MKKNIIISILGTTLDMASYKKRWNKWRPSVALCQHKDLVVDEYHIIHNSRSQKLLDTVTTDINEVSAKTKTINHTIDFNNPWDFQEVFSKLLDLSDTLTFDTEQYDYLIHITTGTHVAQICLFLLTEARYFPAKLIQTSPSKQKDPCCGTYNIIDLDLSQYDEIAKRFKIKTDSDLSFLKSGINTKNTNFNNIISQIEKVSIRSTDPILLFGPTGAGKSNLAKRIYELKKLKQQISGNFVEVNCATLKGDNTMSALFGHIKGSFTGAITNRDGLLKAANNGILFLDEIGELGLDEQAMLLRAIEDKTFLPLGSDKEVQSNFQLICGTNKDLYLAIKRGTFREDLLSRINLWDFYLPGLKDRPEDIEPNIEYELDKYSNDKGYKVTFNQEALQGFLDFALSADSLWSSNFRDLNGAITRMSTLAPGGRITTDIQKEETQRLKKRWEPQLNTESNYKILNRYLSEEDFDRIDSFDKPQLAFVLDTCQKSKTLSEAGRKLFNKSREEKKVSNDADRLRKYLQKFNLTWNDIK